MTHRYEYICDKCTSIVSAQVYGSYNERLETDWEWMEEEVVKPI